MPIEVPISDNAEISQTTVYPNLESMWQECVATSTYFQKYSPETKRTIKFAFYTAVAETLRTVIFRMNMDGDDRVFGEFDKELRIYDLELQSAIAAYTAAIQ